MIMNKSKDQRLVPTNYKTGERIQKRVPSTNLNADQILVEALSLKVQSNFFECSWKIQALLSMSFSSV